jgi:hypothetical protein
MGPDSQSPFQFSLAMIQLHCPHWLYQVLSPVTKSTGHQGTDMTLGKPRLLDLTLGIRQDLVFYGYVTYMV